MDDIGIGIDIGASKIVVAACRGGKSEVVLNGEGRRSTQFCVAFNNKERLFGDAAEGQYSVNPENTINGRDAKQWIGLRKPDIEKKMSPLTNALKVAGENENVKFDVDYKGRTQTQIFPEHIFAMFLRKVKSEMESVKNIKISKAVITVPSMFNSYQRFAVKNAVLAAGIEVQAILNDTTATAITYAIDRHGRDEKNLLIFDMGASSTDVGVVRVNETSVEVKACGGSLELGGDTFDLRLVQHFMDEFENEKGIRISDDKQMVARLRVSCEKLKKKLSDTRDANLFIPSFYKGKAYQLKMTRTTFELICKDLFDKMVTVISDVVVASKLEIHEIVLVGNGVRIPKVEAVISEYFKGKKCSKVPKYDGDVAIGAAHFAAQSLFKEGTIRYLDVSTTTATPLKMQFEEFGCLTLVKKGQLLPLNLETPYEDKKNLSIKFFQGDYFLTFFKLKGAVLDIHWNIDTDGLINLTSQDIDQKQTALSLLNHQKPNDAKIKQIQAFEDIFVQYELEYEKAMRTKDDIEKLCFEYRRQVKEVETKRFLSEIECCKITNICNETLEWLDNPSHLETKELNEKLQTVQCECNFILEKAKYTSEVQKADMLLDEKNYKEANLLYMHILDTYNKHFDDETYFYLTMQRITVLTEMAEMQDYQECIKLSENLMQNLNDEDYIQIVRRTRGRCHFQLKNYQECIEDLEFVLKHEKCPELHNLLNKAILGLNKRTVHEMFAEVDNLTKSKQYDQSNALLQELILKPELKFLANNEIDFKAKIHMMFARNHFQQKEYKKVIQQCSFAETDPDYRVEIWNIRAESYIEEGLLHEAEADIQSLETVETFRKGRLNDLMRKLEGKRYNEIMRGVNSMIRNKEYHVALHLLEQVKVGKLEKIDKLDYFCSQSWLLWALKRFDASIEMCNKALYIDRKHALSLKLRAECYWQLKEYLKAIDDCNVALNVGTSYAKRMQEIKKDCEDAIQRKAPPLTHGYVKPVGQYPLTRK